MKLNFSKKTYYFFALIIGILIVACSVFVYYNSDCFSYKPFGKGPELSSPVFYKVGHNGEQYYIDQGNYRIIAINKDGECEWTYKNTDASYKEILPTPDGRIFVTNYHYVNESIISNISVDEFSSSGEFLGSVYSVSYPVKNLFE